MVTAGSIYTSYMDLADGDPLLAASKLASRISTYHDATDEAQEALCALIREAMLQRPNKPTPKPNTPKSDYACGCVCGCKVVTGGRVCTACQHGDHK